MTEKEQAIESILKLAVQGRYAYLVQDADASKIHEWGMLMTQAANEVGNLFKQAGLIGDNIE